MHACDEVTYFAIIVLSSLQVTLLRRFTKQARGRPELSILTSGFTLLSNGMQLPNLASKVKKTVRAPVISIYFGNTVYETQPNARHTSGRWCFELQDDPKKSETAVAALRKALYDAVGKRTNKNLRIARKPGSTTGFIMSIV